MILALAGRRVDAPDAKPPRFPPENVEAVRDRVRAFLKENGATALVSSAACGADLIGLSEAARLGLKRRVILPFSQARFRETSVTDRPGDWGPLYDRTIHAAEATGELVILDNQPDDEAYAAASRVILDQALALAKATYGPVIAVQIWDGASRGAGDLTEAFGAEARKRGITTKEIRTL